MSERPGRAPMDHDSLYRKALEQVKPAMSFRHGQRLSWIARWKMRRGIALLEKVVTMNPQNWAAYWMTGKAWRACGDEARALEAFTRSFGIHSDNPDVAREASISAMELARTDESVLFAERAVAAAPGDPGLRANLALAYLLAQRREEAHVEIEKAFAADSKDPITNRIRTVVRQVVENRRECPRHLRDLD